MGLFDIFDALSGRPSPQQQIALALQGRAQPPPGVPPPTNATQGPAPADASSPSPAAGTAPPPANPPANPVTPGDPPPPGSPPQPTVLQSSPDMSASYQSLANPPNLMSLYMQLDARNRAQDQFNHGLALIAANHSAPSMREAIMQSVGGQPNAGQQVGDLMQLYNAQNAMGAQQQMLGQADSIDKRLNLPPGTARSMILAGQGSQLISKLEPTDEQRNIQAKHDMFIHGGGTEADWQSTYLPMIISGGVGGDAATRSWQVERINWAKNNPGQPVPWGDDTPQNFALYQQDQKKRQDNVDAAAGSFGQYDSGLSDVRGKIASIQGNPALPSVLQNPALVAAVKAEREQGSNPTLWNSVSKAATDAFAKATPEQKQLASDILDLSDPEYIKSLQGKSSTVTQGDILPITSALGTLGRFNTPPKQYGALLGSALDAVDNARANNYGASNQIGLIPEGDEGDALRKRVNAAYLPGGGAFVGQGKPMPSDELAAAKKSIAADPASKATVVDLYRRHGYNTKPIE